MDEGYEDSEFIYPFYRLIEAGFDVDVIAGQKREYRGKRGTLTKATHSIDEVNGDLYDGVYIPGGHAPERLRINPKMADFVVRHFRANKSVCAVCHGPLLLASAGIIEGKKVTGFHSIKNDLEKAGALYTAKSVEQDGNIITAQDPHSMPEMMQNFLSLL